jgi:hypothetical protein
VKPAFPLLFALLLCSAASAAITIPVPDIGQLNSSAMNIIKNSLPSLQNASGMQNIPAPAVSGMPSAPAAALPEISIPISQLRELVILLVFFTYVFAAGRIADFLQNSGRAISKRELVLAPFAFMFLSAVGVVAYFSSDYWIPPQNTIITEAFYLLFIPLAIAIGIGAMVLNSFFHDRLNFFQSADLSVKIVLSPLFDGMQGYFTALGAAAIVVGISIISYFSSGSDLALVTMDFLLLSVVVSLYFLYHVFTARTNESKASNVVTMLTILFPSVLRSYFTELVCAGLEHLPFGLFPSCPLLQVGNEVTLALSVAATLILLVPVIPVVYAIAVNGLRMFSALSLVLKKETPPKKQKEEE